MNLINLTRGAHIQQSREKPGKHLSHSPRVFILRKQTLAAAAGVLMAAAMLIAASLPELLH